MNIKQFIKFFTIIACLFAAHPMHAMQKQLPPLLEAKFSHLLEKLDTAKQLDGALRNEAHDLIARLQQFGANTEIQRIQKRLNQFETPGEQKTIAAVPLPEIEYLPEESEFEEKKQAFEKQVHAATTTTKTFPQFLKTAVAALKTQGKAAAQKIRNFITAPKTVGAVPTAFLFAIIDYILLRMAYDELWPNQMPLSPEEFTVLSYLIPGVPFFYNEFASGAFKNAIEAGNIKNAKYMLETKVSKPNIIIEFSPTIFRYAHAAGVLLPPQPIRQTPITLAIQHDQPAIVQLLLEQGADIMQEDEQNKRVEDYLQQLPSGKRKNLLKIILEHKLQRAQQIHEQLISQYSPVEVVAEEALKALDKDTMSIVKGYMTPGYVQRTKYPTMPVAKPTQSFEKKETEEKKD